MKLKKVLVAAIVSMMTLLTACGNKPASSSAQNAAKIKDGGSIVFPINSDPQVLNPMYASDRVTMTIDNAIYSPLFVMDGNKIEYYLAESVTPSSDFMKYTLKLKKNLKWHDGKHLNADDIVFTINKILDEKQNSFLRDSFIFNGKPVEVSKLDDTTIEFKLPSLSMAFMSSLSQISPIPKHVYEKETDLSKSAKNDSPIGSGPYKFKEMKKGESVTLAKNDDYVGGKPHLDSVVFRVIADTNSANAAFENGELGAKYVEPKDASKYKNNNKFNMVTYNEGMLDNMLINCSNTVLKNKDIRQAIAYAINKDELIKSSYISSEYAEKAYSIFTPDTLYYTSDVNKFEFNPNKAKELLSKSGVKGLKLTLIYINSDKGQESQALVIQQNLKNVGIDVQLTPMDQGAFYKKLFSNGPADYDLAFNSYVNGTEPDAYKGAFMTGQLYNGSKYESKDNDDLWNKGAVETDKVKRKDIYKKLQKNIADDVAIYPIAYSKAIIAVSKKYGGIKEAKTVPIFMFQDLSKLYITE
ncbi:ABC transporter substrate-binding protein [Clostridium sp. JS66]|uniref:ABC transporter substrate-binding protein n=1 Tax=Clostridium sp. JS66 TaxID=3064705 RepID=UPI00298DE208|nr:ABC transporter substrate-binding protein [Clostridium sp. JS66]WPC42989.1 ABC transporter substrate-binding protein [Clostridium sp. JS66]